MKTNYQVILVVKYRYKMQFAKLFTKSVDKSNIHTCREILRPIHTFHPCPVWSTEVLEQESDQ